MKITYNSTRMKQQNVYYCRLHFSASLASEVSLTLVPVGGCRFEWQIIRGCDEAGPDPNWDS